MQVQALRILDQATGLRIRVREDIQARQFGADDVNMLTYNDLIQMSAELFPNDPVLNGGMVRMPDSNLQTFGTILPVTQMPPEHPSKRLEARLTQLINRLGLYVGPVVSDPEPRRPASQILNEPHDEDVQEIRDALEQLRNQTPNPESIEDRDFAFILDPALRALLKLDFVEAQRSFAAAAFKGSCLLSGSVIEGMLLNQLQLEDTVARTDYDQAVSEFPHVGEEVNWDRASLTQMIKAANNLGFLGASTKKFAEGVRDFRDTIHPRAELREQIRGGQEEAELLLGFVKLVYRDLGG